MFVEETFQTTNNTPSNEVSDLFEKTVNKKVIPTIDDVVLFDGMDEVTKKVGKGIDLGTEPAPKNP